MRVPFLIQCSHNGVNLFRVFGNIFALKLWRGTMGNEIRDMKLRIFRRPFVIQSFPFYQAGLPALRFVYPVWSSLVQPAIGRLPRLTRDTHPCMRREGFGRQHPPHTATDILPITQRGRDTVAREFQSFSRPPKKNARTTAVANASLSIPRDFAASANRFSAFLNTRRKSSV